MRILQRAGIAGLAAAVAVPGAAQTFPTATFNVTITITEQCLLTTPITTMTFGTTGVITTAIEAETTIIVECTDEADFMIEINAGAHFDTPNGTRRMIGTGATPDFVAYGLYQDEDHLIPWGTEADGAEADLDGTGEPETYTVYGLVPVQDTPRADTYTDTVTVTVTY